MAQSEYATVVFGCGNMLMGDDGFGPAVIEKLNASSTLPVTVAAIDAGTGIREYLFDYLLTAEGRPEELIIHDAVDCNGRRPGEVFELAISAIPSLKISGFSLHQFPTVNLLAELQEHTGVQITLLAAQVEHIPDEISLGLSSSMRHTIPVACEKILQLLSEKSSVNR